MERIITFSAPFSGKMRDILRRRFSARFCTFLKSEPGRIFLSGVAVTGNAQVNSGEKITVRFFEEAHPLPPCDLPVFVLYEDEDVLVVEKPQGVASVSTFGYERKNLLGALYHYRPEGSFHIVTRLDKDTAGAVLVAKSGVCHSLLQRSGVDKTYYALCEGTITKKVTVDAPIRRAGDVKREVSVLGKPSVTEILPVEVRGENTLVKVFPKTGRTHQIRVHLAYIGHPIVGDTLYGSGKGAYNGGQLLFCKELRFLHPVTGKEIKVSAENTPQLQQ